MVHDPQQQKVDDNGLVDQNQDGEIDNDRGFNSFDQNDEKIDEVVDNAIVA